MPVRARPNADECVKARILAGLSIADVAEKVGRSDRAIRNLETGTVASRPGLIKALADLYGVPIESLLIFESTGDAA